MSHLFSRRGLLGVDDNGSELLARTSGFLMVLHLLKSSPFCVPLCTCLGTPGAQKHVDWAPFSPTCPSKQHPSVLHLLYGVHAEHSLFPYFYVPVCIEQVIAEVGRGDQVSRMGILNVE